MRETTQPRWYALMTVGAAGFRAGRRAFGELAAVRVLTEDGVEAFTPMRRILVRPSRHAKRRIERFVPLLPGYCFASFAAAPSRGLLAGWKEIVDVVRIGDDPARIPAHQIDILRYRYGVDGTLDDTGAPDPDEPPPPPRLARPGDRVEHTAAVFTGLRFEVESVTGDKAVLTWRLFDGVRRITAPVAELHVIEEAVG